jgi:hypothetical protein
MTKRNFKKELFYSQYIDMENGQDTETIDTLALIELLQEMNERIEQLEKDNELLKSYAWEP